MATKADIGMMLAVYRGYRCDDRGRVFNGVGDEIKGRLNKEGYLTITIKKDGKKFSFLKHRYIAFLTFGDDVFKADCVRHLNDNKTDNRACNLRLGSNRDNYDDRRKNLGSINDKCYN